MGFSFATAMQASSLEAVTAPFQRDASPRLLFPSTHHDRFVQNILSTMQNAMWRVTQATLREDNLGALMVYGPHGRLVCRMAEKHIA